MLLRFIARLITTHRWLFGLGITVMTLLALWGHLRGGPAVWAEASQDVAANDPSLDPEARSLEEVEGFGQSRVDCVVVVEVDDFFTQPAVSLLRRMVHQIDQLPQVDSIIWVDEIPILNIFGVPEPLLPPEGSAAERFVQARDRVLQHPLAVGQLISPDGRTLLMPLSYDWSQVRHDADCTHEILRIARKVVAEQPECQVRIRMTGNVPLFIAQNEALRRNKLKFQIIGYGLALVITVILFRGIVPVLIVAGAPALSIFWSLGILNLLGETTNPLTSVILPVLVSMVGLTDGVHLMMHIRRSRAEGISSTEAARLAIEQIGLACALTSLTTAIGFSSLTLAHAEFIRSFGRACAVGVVVSFVAVVTFIPLMCTMRWARNIGLGYEHDLVGKRMIRSVGLIDWITEHARVVSLCGVLITVLLTLVSFTLRPDNKTKNSLASDSDIYQALAHCDGAMGGNETAQIVVRWPDDVAPDNGRILEIVQRVEAIVGAEPLLRHPLSIRNLLDSFPRQQIEPSARMSFVELMPPPLKNAFFDEANRETRMTVRIQDLGIALYEPVFRRVESKFEGLTAEFSGFEVSLGGDPVRRGRELHRIVMDLATSLGAASGIIFIVLTLVYRSLRIGLISVVPNMLPLVTTASVLVLMSGALDFASVCAFTVCLGIAVDDTIHFLTRFQRELQSDGNVRRALRRSFLGVGTALVTTTIILVLGFSTALTSDLPDHRIFAGMACSTIGAALIGDLVILPAMLTCFWPGVNSRKQVTGQW